MQPHMHRLHIAYIPAGQSPVANREISTVWALLGLRKMKNVSLCSATSSTEGVVSEYRLLTAAEPEFKTS